MDSSPSRVLYEDDEPRLFDCASGGRPDRRLTKAEALEYIRVLRAQLHRAPLERADRPRHMRRVA